MDNEHTNGRGEDYWVNSIIETSHYTLAYLALGHLGHATHLFDVQKISHMAKMQR